MSVSHAIDTLCPWQGHGKVVDRGLRRLKTCASISEQPASMRCRRRSSACAGQRSPSRTDFAVALLSLAGAAVMRCARRSAAKSVAADWLARTELTHSVLSPRNSVLTISSAGSFRKWGNVCYEKGVSRSLSNLAAPSDQREKSIEETPTAGPRSL